MTPEEMEHMLRSHDHNLEVIFELVAGNERRIAQLNEGIVKLLRIAELHQTELEAHRAELEAHRAELEAHRAELEVQRQMHQEFERRFDEFLKRFDAYLRGERGDGHEP
jgi:DNA-binding transcriptional MerR regulator